LRKAKSEAGVHYVAVNGCCEADWGDVQAMHEEYAGQVVPNFGLHPWFLQGRTEGWLGGLRRALERNPEAGLGECGLDKTPRIVSHTTLEVQAEILTQQLRLAKELERPVSLHCVRAWGKMTELLQKEGPFPRGVLLHSFAGPAEVVKGLSRINAFFSVSLSVLRSPKRDRVRAALKAVPLDRLLLETDSPDALCSVPSSGWEGGEDLARPTPVDGLPGGVNHPGNLLAVLDVVSHLIEVPSELVARHTYRNACRFFCKPSA